MKKKGKWGKGLGRLFAGPDESARMPSERSRSKAEPGSDADEIETPEDILAKYRDLATGEEFIGTIRGITPEGLVRIEAEGLERTFGFKEVGYIL